MQCVNTERLVKLLLSYAELLVMNIPTIYFSVSVALILVMQTALNANAGYYSFVRMPFELKTVLKWVSSLTVPK